MTGTTLHRPPVDKETGLVLLREMLRIRRFEEKAAELYSAEQIRGFLHLYIGEEAVAVGAMPALTADDRIVATYREHGHALARGLPMDAIMAEMYGKAAGVSRGRGGSMHLFDASRRFYGGYAIVGGGMPIAVGLALADRLQETEAITACFFGDGAVAEGEFHESLNLAALWKLPVLFLCENNHYAMGTAVERHQSEPELFRKAGAYRIPAERVDGMDVLAVRRATAAAAAAVRAEGTPRFLEFDTFRFRAHSMYDPDRYRTKEEIARWEERDPLTTFPALLIAHGLLTPEEQEALEREVDDEIGQAVGFAEAAEWEPVEGLSTDVYTPAVP